MTGTQALMQATVSLRDAGIPDPSRDARRLLTHALGIAPSRLTLVLNETIAPETSARFDDLVRRRAAREPVSHLVGTRAFYGRDFTVTNAVLDPRPETETLIAAALDKPFSTVIDLGTGSGCILLTLLAERPSATGLGTDLSADALRVANDNARRIGVAERAVFAAGSWFDAIDPTTRADLIVSNPPYIAQDEMAALEPELAFEPRMALTDENDGLSAYRILSQEAPRFLAPGGRLIVEIGPTQGASVRALFEATGFADVTLYPDLDGRDRVVSGVFLPQSD